MDGMKTQQETNDSQTVTNSEKRNLKLSQKLKETQYSFRRFI